MDPIAAASPSPTPPDMPPAPGGLPLPPAPDTDTSFTLTPEQATAAGIGDLQIGDSFKVTLAGTVTDNSNGIVADIEDASDGMKSDQVADADDVNEGADSESEPEPRKPQSRVVGPKEAGFED